MHCAEYVERLFVGDVHVVVTAHEEPDHRAGAVPAYKAVFAVVGDLDIPLLLCADKQGLSEHVQQLAEEHVVVVADEHRFELVFDSRVCLSA